MERYVANTDDIVFDIEVLLETQPYLQPLPFPGMDKSEAPICERFLKDECPYGDMCSHRHICLDKPVVCKHWMRGLCKKGDDCEWLHIYDLDKMPVCHFFANYGQCTNRDCPFMHKKRRIEKRPLNDKGPAPKRNKVQWAISPEYHPRHDHDASHLKEDTEVTVDNLASVNKKGVELGGCSKKSDHPQQLDFDDDRDLEEDIEVTLDNTASANKKLVESNAFSHELGGCSKESDRPPQFDFDDGSDSDDGIAVTMDETACVKKTSDYPPNRQQQYEKIVKCNYCKGLGHMISECPVLAQKAGHKNYDTNQNQQGQSPKVTETNASTTNGQQRDGKIVKCNYCKELGHMIPECPVLARKKGYKNYDTNQNQQGQIPKVTETNAPPLGQQRDGIEVKCNYCKGLGHMISECPVLAQKAGRKNFDTIQSPNGQSPKVTETSAPMPQRQQRDGKIVKCNYCKELGHMISECPVLAKKAGPKDKVFTVNENIVKCHHCKENGHQLFECPVLANRTESKMAERKRMAPSHRGQQARKCNLDQVTCFKCNQKGHFANSCPNSNNGSHFKRRYPDS